MSEYTKPKTLGSALSWQVGTRIQGGTKTTKQRFDCSRCDVRAVPASCGNTCSEAPPCCLTVFGGTTRSHTYKEHTFNVCPSSVSVIFGRVGSHCGDDLYDLKQRRMQRITSQGENTHPTPLAPGTLQQWWQTHPEHGCCRFPAKLRNMAETTNLKLYAVSICFSW